MANTTNDLDDGFDVPNYSGGQSEKWALKEGQTIVRRIFPPMKSLRKTKDIGQYWATHWWQGKNPKSGKPQGYPVLCIEKISWRNGQKIVDQECPLCRKRKEWEKKRDAAKLRGADQAPYVEWLRAHNRDAKVYLYALDKKGAVGVLRLTYTTFKKLKEEVKKLANQEPPVSPMSLGHGVWWEFSRTGKGFDTEDRVEPFMSKRKEELKNGNIIDVPYLELHALTDENKRMALECLPDFNDEIARITYSTEVLEKLYACDDSLQAVNDILGIQSAAPDTEDGELLEEPDFVAPEPVVAKTKATPAPAPVVVADDEGEEDLDVAAIQAQLEAAQAAKAAKAKATKKVVKEEPATVDSTFDEMFK